MKYMIHLRPQNSGHPFAQGVRVVSPNAPRLEGGFVVVDSPVDQDNPNDRTPFFMAWPSDKLGAVIVDELPDDGR